MQINLIIIWVTIVLRLLQSCLMQVRGMFGFQRLHDGTLGSSVLSLSVDLDSARLDAVSRSLLWGSGMPVPEPARTAGCPPRFVPGPWRRCGTGPEIYLHRDV